MSGLPTAGRLRPQTTKDTEFFWDAAAAGRLEIQRCEDCGKLRYPPGPACPTCHSLAWAPQEMSGQGHLFSYTVIYHPSAPGFAGPAVVGVIELDEGVRLVTNLDVDPGEELRIGERFEVFFLDQLEGWSVPQFRRSPAESAGPAHESAESDSERMTKRDE